MGLHFQKLIVRPWKWVTPEGKLVFKPFIFSGYFSFREGILFKRSARHCQIIWNGSRRKQNQRNHALMKHWVPRHSANVAGALVLRSRYMDRKVPQTTAIEELWFEAPVVQQGELVPSQRRWMERSLSKVQEIRSEPQILVEARQRSSARVEAAEWLSLIEPWVP